MMLRISPMIALLAILPIIGCGRGDDSASGKANMPPAPVQTEKVERRDLTRHALFIGSVEPVRVARMASPAEGPIVDCAVREGDSVTKGQRLVRVGRSLMAESGLEAAREELKRQEREFDRVTRLVESGSLPGEDLDIARAALKRAEALVVAAETGAGDYEIRAPWNGTVSKVWVAEGNYVAPRAPLVELYDPASLRIRFSVPEQDMRMLRKNTLVDVTLDAYPGAAFPGVIERMFAELEPATRTLAVEARLTGDVELLSGLFARVRIPMECVSEALVIPSGALISLPGGASVVFIAEEGKAVRRAVKTGLESDGLLEITEGLAAGEEVIVRGQEGLKEGARIRNAGAKAAGGRPDEAGAKVAGDRPDDAGESPTGDAAKQGESKQ